jgi:F-type H+-transporting ATPase subunit epsilon
LKPRRIVAILAAFHHNHHETGSIAMPLNLEIVTPERPLLSVVADEITVPALGGEIGVLPGHAPLLSQMSIAGLLSYRAAGKERVAFVGQGFVEISNDRVTILADRAELAEDINLEGARAALRDAEQALQKVERDNGDATAAQSALESAQARVKAAERLQAR